MKRIDSFAKEKGYVTGFSSDFCSLYEREFFRNYGRLVFPDPIPPDHEFLQIACDLHNFPLNSSLFFIGRGPFSASKNCFMGKDLATPHMEYAR